MESLDEIPAELPAMVTASEIVHAPDHARLLVHDRSGKPNCFNCIIEDHQTKAYNLARRMLDDW